MHMSKISLDEVKHIAKLAKIKLSTEEIKTFAKQLESIIDYFDQLNEIDTKGVRPTSQVTGITNRLRQDNVGKYLNKDDTLRNAPKKKDNYFVALSAIDRK